MRLDARRGLLGWTLLATTLGLVVTWQMVEGASLGPTTTTAPRQLGPAGTPTPTLPPPATVTGADLRVLYGVTQVPVTGAGKMVGIVDVAVLDSLPTDVALFSSANNLPPAQLTIVTVPDAITGACARPTVPPGTSTPTPIREALGETQQDVQAVHALAPNAAILLAITGRDTPDCLSGAARYAVQQGANTVSISFANPEAESVVAYGTAIAAIGTPAIYVASSSDSGWLGPAGNTPTPGTTPTHRIGCPACLPGVVAAGGTRLYYQGASYVAEETWGTLTPPPTETPGPTPTGTRTPAPGLRGSGGGISTALPVPTYQAPFAPQFQPGTGPHRMNPDVAALADARTGLAIYIGGEVRIGDGTSLSAPIWAGLLALAAPPGTSSEQALGALYALAQTPTAYAANFHDVTLGGNGPCGALCLAQPGYDLTTGLGSPRGESLVPTLGALLGATPLPSSTPTLTSTPSPTLTVTATRSATASPPSTATPTPSRTPSPAATATPTPTGLPTLPPTPTPVAPACAARPAVEVVALPNGDGRLRVTVSATTNAGTPTNALSAIHVAPTENALVYAGLFAQRVPFTVTLAPGTQSETLYLGRVTVGQATTAQLTVTDACGPWPTVVGGGPAAF